MSDAATVRAAAPYLEQWLATQAAVARVPGVQAAVRVGGELVLDVATGVADVATGVPLRTDHAFRVASHSKTFTATVVALLAREGRLRLDDTLAQHVPELEGSAVGPVTLREALGHTGGVLRDGRDADHWQLGMPFPDRAGVVAHLRGPGGATFAPGVHFKYSNLTYGALGLVVEAVTGEPYAEHVRRVLLEPLGLARTSAELGAPTGSGAVLTSAELVTGHSTRGEADDRRLPVQDTTTGALASATGFCSTAADLTAWAGAHVLGDERVVPDAVKRLLQRDESVVRRPHAPVRGYGLGFETREIEGRRVVGHSGGFPGHITRTWVDPVGGVAVSVLTNAVDGPADTIAAGLLALVDLALTPVPGGAGQGGTSGTDLDRWTGRFANLWGCLDVVRLGDRLVTLAPRSPDPLAGLETVVPDGDVLRPEDHAGFGPVGEPVEVLRAPDGTIEAIVVGGTTSWPAAAFEAQRVALLGSAER